MTDIRNISMGIWNDPELKSASRNGKFLWWYFLTSPHGENDLGLYIVKNAYVMADLELTRDEYENAKDELKDRNLIVYDETMEMVFIKNFLKYHPAYSQNHAVTLKRAFGRLPESQLKGEFIANLEREEIYSVNRNDLFRRMLSGEKIGGTTVGRRWGTKDPDGYASLESNGIMGMMDHWNTICKPAGLPGVDAATPKRKEKVKSRLAEHPIEWWIDVFHRIKLNPFLCGTNKQSWKANFDWVTNNPDNSLKVLEGAYGANNSTSPKSPPTIPPKNTKDLWGKCPECSKETLKEEIEKYGSCQTCFKPLAPEKQQELIKMLSGIGKEIPSGRDEKQGSRNSQVTPSPTINDEDGRAPESATRGTSTGEARSVNSECPGPEAGREAARDS